MSDSFQCPKCGASYARERRRIGKAVVCSCGHKFLVPPPASEEPPANARPYAAPPNVAPRGRAVPRPPRKQASSSSDSSAEVLPLAEVIEPAGEPPAGRWAEAIEPAQAEPLPQAEIVDSGIPYAEPVLAGDDLFSSGGPYGGLAYGGTYIPPRASPPPPRSDKRRRKKSRSSGDGGQIGFSNWVAYIVLFLLLPAAGIFTLLGVVEYRRTGSAVGVPQRAGTSAAPPAASPTASYPITILSATKKATSDEFTMQFDVRGGPLDPAGQYIWVVSSPRGRIEFPMTPPTGQGRGEIAGKPAQPADLSPPFTTYIEQQSGGARTRVSNEITVMIGA
ncbi:MAG: hypothetical protein ACREHD_24900 [Pirellulales bacterium]